MKPTEPEVTFIQLKYDYLVPERKKSVADKTLPQMSSAEERVGLVNSFSEN